MNKLIGFSITVAFVLIKIRLLDAQQLEANPKCYTPESSLLLIAVRTGNVTVFRSNVKSPEALKTRYPCLKNSSLLHEAAVAGSTRIVRWLIEQGAPVEDRTADGSTALHEASRAGHLRTVKVLVEKNAARSATDNQGRTPLHLAAGKAPYVVQFLLTGRRDELEARDQNGETPLHRAVIRGSLKSLEVLIRAGADVNATNSQGESGLHLSTSHRWLNATRLLLESGGNPNIARSGDSWTPLHVAAAANSPRAAGLLLQHGADPGRRDSKGRTPLDVLQASGVTPDPVLLGLLGGSQPVLGSQPSGVPG